MAERRAEGCRQADEGCLAATLGLAALLLVAILGVPAQAAETALTPTRVIYPGETVSADAVSEVRMRAISAAAGPFATDLAQIDGKVAKRTLVPGKLIPIAALRQAWVVEQGKPVEVVYSLNNLSISLTAVALESGAVGDFVRLRNPDSGKTFSGTVLANGTVAVGGS